MSECGDGITVVTEPLNDEGRIKESTLKRRPQKKKKQVICPSKCQACFSFLIMVVMLLAGFNTTMPGILCSGWKEKFDLTYEQLARIWMFDGLGIMSSSLLSALLPVIECTTGVGLGVLLMSIFPIYQDFIYFQLSSLVSGLGKGLIFVYGIKSLGFWPKSSLSVLVQLAFVSYSLGGLLASQLTDYYTQFVIVFDTNLTFIGAKNSSILIDWFVEKQDVFRFSLIQLGIIAISFLIFLTSCSWSMVCCCRLKCNRSQIISSKTIADYEDFRSLNKSVELRTDDRWQDSRKNESFKNNVCGSSQKWFASDRVFDVSVLMFLFIHFTFAYGLESVLVKFLSTLNYVLTTEKQPYSFDTYFLYSIFCSLTIVGRFLSISFSKSYSSTAIVAICLATNVVASAIISAYHEKSENLVLFCIAVFSAFLGPLLPAGLTWANSFLADSVKSIGLAFCCAGLGNASLLWISGVILTKFDPIYLIFFVTATSCLCTIMYTPLLVTITKASNGKCIQKPTSTYV